MGVKDGFVRDFVSTVAGKCIPRLDADTESAVFDELSRGPELRCADRDQWGNWEWPYAAATRRGVLDVPWIDRRVSESVVASACAAEPVRDEARWPGGRSFAVCLTHDVDVVSSGLTARLALRSLARARRSGGSLSGACRAALSGAFRQQWRHGEPDALWHYEDWLGLENQFGFKSTFFFFPSTLGRSHPHDCTYQFRDAIRFNGRRMTVAEMIREIGAAGWEVGLHGSFYSGTIPGLLNEQKEELEKVTDEVVTSTRQHYLRWDARLTPRIQAQAGLKVDSTQGFNRGTGFRAGTCFPYMCWDHEGGGPLDLWEIPLHVMDGALFTVNAFEFSEDRAVSHVLQVMTEVERVGGVLTLDWHPHYLNDEKWWAVYRRILEEAAARGAWGTSARDLIAWWLQRRKQVLESWDPSSGTPPGVGGV